MNKIETIAIFAILLTCSTGLWSDEVKGDQLVLKESAKKAVVDGKIAKGEYELTIAMPEGVLGISRTAGSLTFFVSFKTKGWIAIGFGSATMNESRMVMACVKDGTPTVTEQLGAGHRHSDSDKSFLVKQSAGETDGVTALEGEILLKSLIKGETKTLPIILAFGKSDSMTARHSYKKTIEITIE